MKKPLVGISTCLLGHEVRYDGGHKLMHYLRDTLGTYVDFISICPEYECGMSIPREALRLVQTDSGIQLQTQKGKEDKTGMMTTWMEQRLEELSKRQLCGYIFKSKSPSCGVFRVKEYSEEGVTLNTQGAGIYAKRFGELFPHIPVEEDGRLHDSPLRENFVERVFAMFRWYELNELPRSMNSIMSFHASYKYTLMAHSPKAQKDLGALIANSESGQIDILYETYFIQFMDAIKEPATVKKNTNALQHIMGYFKKDLSGEEKEELSTVITQYHDHLIPLIVPITLLNHYVRKYKPPYLQNQYYLAPHPMELMLRNHV